MNIRPDDHLLNDLIDGRLASDEAAALRSRLEAEPELMERYTELTQVGELMRSWDPAAALDAPASLSASVRAGVIAEAGPTDVATNGQSAGTQDTASGGGASADGAAPRGRMFRLISYAYAAAAVLVLGVTLAVTLGDDPKPNSLGADGVPPVTDLALDKEKHEKQLRAGGLLEDDAGSKAQPRPLPAKRPGHFGPSGAVPPGLREPSDAPPPAPTEAKPGASGNARPGAAGGVSAPDAARAARGAKEGTGDRGQAGDRDKLDEADHLHELGKRDPAVDPAPVTYMLEVKDTTGVRAQLSLLVAALEREGATLASLRTAKRDMSVGGGGAKDESPTKRARRDGEPSAQGEMGSAKSVVEALREKGARFYRPATRAEEPANDAPAKPAGPTTPTPPASAPPTTPAAPGAPAPADAPAEGAVAPEQDAPKSEPDDREELETARGEVIEIRMTPEALARLEKLTSGIGTWSGQAEPAASTPRAAPAAKATGGEPPVTGRPPVPDANARRKKKSDKATGEVVVRIVLVRRK